VEFVAPKRLAIGPQEQVLKLARLGESLGEVTRQEHQGLDHTEMSVFSRLPEVVTRFPAVELIRFGATNGKDQLVGLCWNAEATLELEAQVCTSQASLVQFALTLGAEVLACAKQEKVAQEQSTPQDRIVRGRIRFELASDPSQHLRSHRIAAFLGAFSTLQASQGERDARHTS
jgi:hypothetical protein